MRNHSASCLLTVSFLHNLTNSLTWMSTNLERVGSLAVRLGLSWNMKIQNCKYFWNSRHCLLFTSGGTPSLTKETVSSMKEVSNSWMTSPYFVQLIIQDTLSRCLGWRMMINRGKRKLGETKNFRYLLKYIPWIWKTSWICILLLMFQGRYTHSKNKHMWPCPVEGRNVDILGEMTCRSYLWT